jgi:hypothetical protein
MQLASRGVAIVAAVAVITGLAACSDNAVNSPAVRSAAASAQPSSSPIEASPSTAAPSPSVALASPSVALPIPSVAPAPAATANPAKVVVGHAYRPRIEPAEFTTDITNPYFPLVPGTVWTYKGAGERVVTAVTSDTKTIMGIETIVVRDRGFENGSLTEDTRDFFAQDGAGNVWYFGEETAECDNGRATSTAGAWKAGVDGAQPGVVMLAAPSVGQYYRQEYLRGEAEDVARVKKVDATTRSGAKTYKNTVVTEDFTALEPGSVEQKTYVPNLGLVESRYVKGGSGAEILIDVKTGVRTSSMPSGKLCRM